MLSDVLTDRYQPSILLILLPSFQLAGKRFFEVHAYRKCLSKCLNQGSKLHVYTESTYSKYLARGSNLQAQRFTFDQLQAPAFLEMKFTDSRITQQLVNTVQAIIDGPGGSLTKWKRVMAELHKVNIPYTQHLSIFEVMVHPENRGGLGLNTFNVHENLRTIKEIGADREAVHRATCFEMVPVGPDREAQIAFNNQLIERSSGQLAPLSGKERVCSVACSHFTAGCRAAEGACLTPESSLADSDGRLNKIPLCGED